MIGTGAMSDPYMHCEEKLRLTRRCLEVIDRHGFGVTVLTKSDMILRDADLLCSINSKAKAVVQMTLTTYDENLCRILEPNVCTTKRRYEVLKAMRKTVYPLSYGSLLFCRLSMIRKKICVVFCHTALTQG